jgi:hypothetical protein
VSQKDEKKKKKKKKKKKEKKAEKEPSAQTKDAAGNDSFSSSLPSPYGLLNLETGMVELVKQN